MKVLLVFITTYCVLTTIRFAACLPGNPNSLPNAGSSKEFVKKIKEDLRRNNDDYKEFNPNYIYNNLTTPPLTTPHVTSPSLPVSRPPKEDSDIHVVIKSPYASINETRRLLEEGSNEDVFYSDTTLTTTRTDHSDNPKTAPENDVLSKRKSKKYQGDENKTETEKGSGVTTSDGKRRNLQYDWAEEYLKLGMKRTTPIDKRNPPSQATLSIQQLDMAPAKGDSIDKRRLKNRLCDRNLLIPEGPKWDSSGTMYLLPFRHGTQRSFSHTKHPRILLPICCNCCKKSVLGCE